MGEEVVVSRRAWLRGLAGRAAGHVAEAVEDRIPAPLLPADESDAADVDAADVDAADQDAARLADGGAPEELLEPVPVPTVLHLRANRCIAIIGIDCGACARLCPEGVRGLWMERRKPVIDPVACVSCGACVDACPTSPRALELLPDPTFVADAARGAAAGAELEQAADATLAADDVGAAVDAAADVVEEPVRPDWSVSE